MNYLQNYRERIKKYLVECTGGKCRKCGYDKHFQVLDFHHIKKKKHSISYMICKHFQLEKIVQETKKCILLCSNCHRSLHFNLWKISEREKKIYFNDKVKRELFRKKKKELFKKKCKVCSKILTVKSNSEFQKRQFCSHKCSYFAHRRTKWPTRNQLKKEIKRFSWLALGRKYKVSDNAVRKWARKHKII